MQTLPWQRPEQHSLELEQPPPGGSQHCPNAAQISVPQQPPGWHACPAIAQTPPLVPDVALAPPVEEPVAPPVLPPEEPEPLVVPAAPQIPPSQESPRQHASSFAQAPPGATQAQTPP